MIKAVIFDMDGLLIDSEPYWQETERMIMGELGIDIDPGMQKQTFGLRTDEQLRYWYNRRPWNGPGIDDLVKKYDDIILDFFLSRAELMKGAGYILDFFQKQELKKGLASSSNMVLIKAFIDRFKLNDYFDEIVSAENEKHGKPHPAVYLNASKALGVEAFDCLAFEDSLVGVIAAKAAKMKVVAIPGKGHSKQPGYALADYKLKSLLEFKQDHLNKLNEL